MFDENSALVIIWVENIKNGKYTREQIPNISNLKDIILELLNEK